MTKIKSELFKFGIHRFSTFVRKWGRGGLCLLILLLCSIGSSAQGTQRKLDESVVRAYVVVAILKYTQWGHSSKPLDKLTLCSVGEPLSQEYLANAVSSFAHPNVASFSYFNLDDKSTGNLPDGSSRGTSSCDVLVVGPRFESKQRASGDKDALFICDGLKQGAQDCAVKLGLTKGKVSFAVNLNHAEASGTVFSSSLLELAESIEGRR